ncbi:hypothetical protein AGLY_001801 [Aphis glycines]|uniref:alpha-1,2-Mannosidase n=1 Tax=Aphis glycines TaxID=307491 RepID=A0A6G0U754_APHGL|nr:hypothetical protein AGLY_001801 [Aphis glycines]
MLYFQIKKMKFKFHFSLMILLLIRHGLCSRHYDRHRLLELRSEVKEMFEHAYHGYMKYAYPYDELRPLTCDGVDTWGSYSLSLIDALDTLVVMGLHDEFNKAVDYIKYNVSFDADINVSVFETNIRVVGGLLSAHMLSHRATTELEVGWPCNGPLLRMAEDVARRLLPAFDTPTGMPYGTVNLRSGVPEGETTVTCTAGVGTFILEFGTLSRLTGDFIFEQVALKALHSLFNHRSKMGLMGNHLDVSSGLWIAHDSGIGGGIDSYFEYLVKGSLLFNLPHLRSMFDELRKPIDKYSATSTGWYFWVNMQKGQVTMPIYQSLESYWPGLLSLIGDIDIAMKSMSNYHDVLKLYGFTPEVYNVVNQEAARDSFPLRPELVESAMYLYKATNGDPYLLDIGSDILRSIQHSSRTRCGYATIKSCKKHSLQNRMESFFLAETTKYLYLLFDPDNFIHNDGSHGKVWNTAGGRECIVDAGGYIFNTEAHPIDPGILHCCYMADNNDWSHRQQPKYQRFMKSSLVVDQNKESTNQARGTVTGENGSSASGHGFTVDESSVYWTQHAHEDQRPQFKNDHQKPTSDADRFSGRSPTMESLQPPPMPPPSSRPPVIYRTDDQLQDNRRQENDRETADNDDKRFESSTQSQENTVNLDVSGSTVTVDSNDFHDYDDGFKDPTTSNRQYQQPSSTDYDHNRNDNGDDENWKAKQHRWTSVKRQKDYQDDDDASTFDHDDGDNGYQVLACPASNNFYTHYRW